MKLIDLADLRIADIQAIWNLVNAEPTQMQANVAWSFEGNGIRTRTSFMQAFRELGFSSTELPNFLKTDERICDLAGYLDPFYDIYVVRDSNHQRLMEFAQASQRPVINAMSSMAHPCEVLTDAYFINAALVPLDKVRICLWGPPGNVFYSWHELAQVFSFEIVHVCNARYHKEKSKVKFTESIPAHCDLVITDGWSKSLEEPGLALTLQHMEEMGNPYLLPTPPFIIGRELAFDPLLYPRFVGYKQKELLLPVQKSILRYMLGV